jgi:colanic acid/amylovoran biosynthesis glycosyltransferase
MRIAYLTTEYPKASHTFIRREIVELERRGHAVTRLAIQPPGDSVVDPVDQAETRLTVHCLAQPKTSLFAAALGRGFVNPIASVRAARTAMAMGIRSERGLARHGAYLVEACYFLDVLRKRDVQHVHAHFGTNAATVARLIRVLGGPRYSFTVHGPDEYDAPRSLKLGQKVADSAFTVAISDYCSAQLRRWVDPVHWSKINVVHCAVDERFFGDAPLIPPDSKQLVCVGRLSAQKGQIVLLDAFKELVRRGVEGNLVLAGDGEMRPLVERRIAELDLKGRVSITGWIDESTVRRLLVESRGLVLPSFAEGLPVVIMEAMAMRRPVLSTAIAGIPELIVQGQTGWMLPAGNVASLVEGLELLLTTSTSELDAMGEKGRARVKERHHTVTEVDKLERLFHRAVNGEFD